MWPAVDTRWWNIGAAAAATVVAATAMSACGDVSRQGGGDRTDGESCRFDFQCASGTCTDRTCGGVDCGAPGACCDGGCYDYDPYYTGYDYYEPPDYDYDYETTTGPFENCQEDLDCFVGEVCARNICEQLEQLPSCDLLALDLESLDGGADDGEPVLSLAFVDMNGDGAEELVVSRPSGTRLLSSTEPPVDLPFVDGVGAIAAVGDDFNDDGAVDIALTDGTSIYMLLADEEFGFSLVGTTELLNPVTDLLAFRDGSDGILDLIGYSQDGPVDQYEGNGSGGLAYRTTLALGPEGNVSAAVGDFNGDGLSDVVVQDHDSTDLLLGLDNGFFEPAGQLESYDFDTPRGRTLLAADLNAAPPWEVIGFTSIDNGWAVLEVWREGGQAYYPYALEEVARLGAIGDYDGDGRQDVILVGDDTMTFVRGSHLNGFSPPLECRINAPTVMTPDALAVGDFDGNGRADVVLADVNNLVLFLAQDQ